MGVGEISWIGRPRPETEGLATFLMGRPNWCGESGILDESFDVEYGPELAWALAGRTPDLLVCVTEDRDELALGLNWADRNRVPVLSAVRPAGVGSGPTLLLSFRASHKTRSSPWSSRRCWSMRSGATLPAGRWPPTTGGGPGFEPVWPVDSPQGRPPGGNRGIGVWTAVALAAKYGDQLHLRLWDFDQVTLENLNRQALFTEEDALAQAPKADAALRSLARIFPRVRIASEVGCLGLEDAARLEALSPRPTALLSAVDNAATRLAIQHLGRELRLPVIHGGTATFAADCFTQEVGAPCSTIRCMELSARRRFERASRTTGAAAAPSTRATSCPA